MQIFSSRLKELREERQLSILRLAKELNVNHSTISRWERNEILPTIDNLYNIARYFGVSSDYLIGLED